MRSWLPLLAATLSLASAWDISNANDRHACQLHSRNPLQGCDHQRTVFVDVGGNSKFQTVQSGNKLQYSICSNFHAEANSCCFSAKQHW